MVFGDGDFIVKYMEDSERCWVGDQLVGTWK